MDCGAINCDEIGITPEQYLRKVIRLGADGCPALSLAAVEGDGDCTPFFECGPDGGPSPQMSWKQLFFALTGSNPNGCPSINVVVSGANCALQQLDRGTLHCDTVIYIMFVNPFANITYLGYYYVYEKSTDNATWTVFGGNTYYQDISADAASGIFHYYRVTVRCNQNDSFFRVFNFNQDDGFPFDHFMRVSVNGGPLKALYITADQPNYFCEGDTIRFFQANPNFSTDVTGPTAWNVNNKTFLPGTLPTGIYDANFQDISGDLIGTCVGQKQFEILYVNKAVISGPTEICFGETGVLDAGAGYDHYLWSTGATTQTITIAAGGTYWVKAWMNVLTSCKLKSDDYMVTVKPALPALSVAPDPGDPFAACAIDNGDGTWTVPNGVSILFKATAGFTDYNFGAGPQGLDNTYTVNGSVTSTLIATLDGCSTSVPFVIIAPDSNITVVTAKLGDNPCCWRITFTDPRLDIPSLIVRIYDSALNETDFIAQQTFVYCNPLGDPDFTVLIDSQTDSNGCPLTYLQTFHCS